MKNLFSTFQSLFPSCTIKATSSHDIQILIPKSTTSEKDKIVNEVRRNAEQAKNELRDTRRKLINDYKNKSTDKDANLRFEKEKQKEYEDAVSKIDNLVTSKISFIMEKSK